MELIPETLDPSWGVHIYKIHGTGYVAWSAQNTVYACGTKVFIKLKSSQIFEDFDLARLDWESFAFNLGLNRSEYIITQENSKCI